MNAIPTRSSFDVRVSVDGQARALAVPVQALLLGVATARALGDKADERHPHTIIV